MRRLLIACLLLIMWADSNHASSQSDSSLFHLTHRIGRGTPHNIEWQPDGDKLLVSTVTGAWLYTDTLDDVAHIEDAKLATFHPSGRLLAGVDENNSITLWNADTFEHIESLEQHTARITQLAWSPEGDRIASMDQDGHILIWQTDSYQPTQRMVLQEITQIGWSSEGTYLAAITQVGRMQVWDAHSGQMVFSLPNTCQTPCYTQFQWRNDQQLLRWWLIENYVGELWDVTTEQMILETSASGAFGPPAYSPDGEKLAWGPMFRDGLSGEKLTDVPGLLFAWSLDGKTVAGSSYTVEPGDTVRVTVSSALNGEVRQAFQEAAQVVNHLAWHADGDRLAGAGDGVKVWCVSTGEILGAALTHSGLGGPSTFSSDGNFLAGTYKRTVQVWDARTGEFVGSLIGHGQEIAFVVWQPSGSLIATSTQGRYATDSVDNTVRIWNSQRLSGNAASYTYSHDRPIQGVAWSPDGAYLASLDSSGTAKLWDANTRRIILEVNVREPLIFDEFPTGFEWSLGGKWIHVRYWNSGSNGLTALFRANTGEFIRKTGTSIGAAYGWTLDDHLLVAVYRSWSDVGMPSPIYEIVVEIIAPDQGPDATLSIPLETLPTTAQDAEFHPLGEAFAVITRDSTLWVWDIPSGNRRFKLTGITELSWDPSGKLLGGFNGVDRIWHICDVKNGAVLASLPVASQNAGYLVWSPDGQKIAQVVDGVVFFWER